MLNTPASAGAFWCVVICYAASDIFLCYQMLYTCNYFSAIECKFSLIGAKNENHEMITN